LDLPSWKRYRGTSELVEDDEEEDEEVEESLDSNNESEDAVDEGPTAEGEDHAAGDEAPVVETAVGEPLGQGYGALRRQEIALGEGRMPSVFEVGQSSRSVPEHERPERVSALRQPTLTTWIDPEDGITYIDVPAYPPPAPLVHTPPSPEWSSGSLPVSSAPSIVPLPISSPIIPLTIPSLVASPATVETEGFLTDDTQRENRELRLQISEERRARLDLAEIVDSMRRGQEPRGDFALFAVEVCQVKLLECDSTLHEELPEIDNLPSFPFGNEDKVFNPGILVHGSTHVVTNEVTQDKNLKEKTSSEALLILVENNFLSHTFDRSSNHELLFFLESTVIEALLSFSSKNEDKVFNPEIHSDESKVQRIENEAKTRRWNLRLPLSPAREVSSLSLTSVVFAISTSTSAMATSWASGTQSADVAVPRWLTWDPHANVVVDVSDRAAVIRRRSCDGPATELWYEVPMISSGSEPIIGLADRSV
ncbi:hypothetical protein Tco_0848116, partial [Tanacetum coccineum]